MEYYLYIIMRSDMASMTPGRACAQASHATSLFESFFNGLGDFDLIKHYKTWKAAAGRFGTTIVLDAGTENLDDIVDRLYSKRDEEFRWAFGYTHDPEYSVQDGDVTHLVAINTCLWVFAPKEWMKNNSGLRLY